MIKGMSTSTTSLQTVLSALQSSPYTFQLTGSRYFGNSTENSDYDFFVQEDGFGSASGSLRRFLFDNDFDCAYQCDIDYGMDISVIDVYKHYCGIHVQVVRDFKIKEEAQEEILKSGINTYLSDKVFSRFIWKLVLTLVEKKKSITPVTVSYLYSEDALAVIREVYPKAVAFGPTSHSLHTNKIAAIKLYRMLTGVGLVSSKDAIESLLK